MLDVDCADSRCDKRGERSSEPRRAGRGPGARTNMIALLISTYELGHQPFGLASPAAWLRREGIDTSLLDVARQDFDESLARSAGLVAFHLPMHMATRLAAPLIRRVRSINP